MAADADLMGIGRHCSAPGCGQVDFLPFVCDCCARTFCLDHRTYAAHACASTGARATEVIVCPLCAKGVRLQPGQDPNSAFEEHQRTQGCDPRNYARVHQKKKCPVGRCSEKLTLTNTYVCKACGTKVCLKHRLPNDHGCEQAKQAAAAARATAAASKAAASPMGALWSRATGSAAPRPASARVAQMHAQDANPANSVKGTAHRRGAPAAAVQALAPASRAATPAGARAVPTSNVNPLVPAHLPEECPQCGARFANVDRLVRHVEEYHPAGANDAAAARPTSNPLLAQAHGQPRLAGGVSGHTGAAGGVERFRCDTCRMLFDDPVALIRHADHCARRSAAAAQSGGGSGTSSNCAIS